MIMEEGKIEIIEYRDAFSSIFTALNLAWLKKYFSVEPIDEEMLSDPKRYIIDNGGHIFFARFNNEIAGTFAFMKAGENVYELSKMAVSENLQGRKIGNYMLEFALKKARDLHAHKLILYSNTTLGAAIHLYRKYGFKEVAITDSQYKRSNIK